MKPTIILCLIFGFFITDLFAFKLINEDDPIVIVTKFINDLGKKDFKSAYEKTDGKIWGTYTDFSSEKTFGCIYSTTIHEISKKPDENGKAVVYADATYLSTAGSSRYKEKFFLEKINDSWKIVKLKVISAQKIEEKKENLSEKGVLYNKNGILTTCYKEEDEQGFWSLNYTCINTITGNKIKFDDIFKVEFKDIIIDLLVAKTKLSCPEQLRNDFSATDFDLDDHEIYLTQNGIKFSSSCQRSSGYFQGTYTLDFTFEELKPYLKNF